MLKKRLTNAFFIIAAALFIAIMLDWVLDFGEQTTNILRAIMFSFIGLGYSGIGITRKKNWVKLVLIACGLYLIAMNFIPKSTMLTIIGIFSILALMLIIRFYRKKITLKTNTHSLFTHTGCIFHRRRTSATRRPLIPNGLLLSLQPEPSNSIVVHYIYICAT